MNRLFSVILTIAKETGIRKLQAECLSNLAYLYGFKNFGKEVRNYKKALGISKEIEDIELQRVLTMQLSLLYFNRGKLKTAYNYCKNSIELSELVAGGLLEDEHKVGFYSISSNAYECMVEICIKLNRDKEALEYCERSKSKALVDILSVSELRSSVKYVGKRKRLFDSEFKLHNHLKNLKRIWYPILYVLIPMKWIFSF
jgi:hypothetical protein